MNIQPTQKYVVAHEVVEKNRQNLENSNQNTTLQGLKKLINQLHDMHNTISRGIKKPKNKLRSPLEKGDHIYILLSRLKKKMHQVFFIKVQLIKNLSLIKKKNLQLHIDMKKIKDCIYIVYKRQKAVNGWNVNFCVKSYLP